MGVSSSQLQPQELLTFKKLPMNVSLLDTIEIPERAENRKPTNVKWLIILGVFILILLPFLIYTLYYSDISRIVIGYDKCGNICGKKNYQWDSISCSGKDFINYPFLEYTNDGSYTGGNYRNNELNADFRERKCVQSCGNGYIAHFGRCYKQRQSYQLESYPGHDISIKRFDIEDIDLGVYYAGVKWQIIISCLLSILVAIGVVFLFRYAVAFVVWGILLGCFIGLLILVGAFWYFYATAPESSNSRNDTKLVFLVFGVVFTIFAIVLGCVLLWTRMKVRLVILLLKETTKAIFDMPGLIALPVLSEIAILLLSGLFLVTIIFMDSAGKLQLARDDFYVYVQNPVMLFTMIYNFIVYLWLTQFFTGIQYMIVAGAVSKWYFARDKNYLGSPILNSASVALKYHLGTIAMGSLIITIIQVIKSIILSLIKNQKIRLCVQVCVESVERFFKFLSKNAYIITAMHGQSFLRSGKRAARLIFQNISDVIAVNYIGDFVLGMAKFLIVVISVLLSAAIFAIAPGPTETSDIPAYIVIGILALLIAVVSFGVFETTIDTIFICYCEDNLLNDGMAKPYFMSRNMKEFIQESKQIYGKK